MKIYSFLLFTIFEGVIFFKINKGINVETIKIIRIIVKTNKNIVGLSRRPKQLIKVDFPLPDFPKIKTKLELGRTKLTSTKPLEFLFLFIEYILFKFLTSITINILLDI